MDLGIVCSTGHQWLVTKIAGIDYSKLPVCLYSTTGERSLVGACAKKCHNTVCVWRQWPGIMPQYGMCVEAVAWG